MYILYRSTIIYHCSYLWELVEHGRVDMFIIFNNTHHVVEEVEPESDGVGCRTALFAARLEDQLVGLLEKC